MYEKATICMSKRFKQKYYDLFSRIYDQFVALHSHDREGKLRQVFTDTVKLRRGAVVLDLCTGTGALLPGLISETGEKGLVFGLDFSNGMLRRAGLKLNASPNLLLVQADAAALPFQSNVFDAVTCSHAFYELDKDASHRCLNEVVRILHARGRFLMMEHDVPKNRLVRVLFYMRIFLMGRKRALQVLKDEEGFFRLYFDSVEKVLLSAGRSKVVIAGKQQD